MKEEGKEKEKKMTSQTTKQFQTIERVPLPSSSTQTIATITDDGTNP
jgi:hypothetical protein